MENILQETLAGIIREHHPAAAVFEKYHLDYCCKGKRPLAAACAEAGIDTATLLPELESAIRMPDAPDLQEKDAIQLIGRILLKHHFYVRQAAPAIHHHLARVVTKHGARYPYMLEVYQLFIETEAELMDHMQKEEMVLFPRIQQVYHAGKGTTFSAQYLSGPIGVMEEEHSSAGNNLYAIRRLLNNYTPPQDACTTHRLVLDELKAFEEDLHQHVHLENNILFPLAQQMLKANNKLA